MAAEILLSIRDLQTSIVDRGRVYPIVDSLNLDIHRGEVVALVGESGSGKTLTAWSVMGLLPEPDVRVTRGSILFNGRNVVGWSNRAWESVRGKDVSMIFQEPGSALNPVMTCGRQIAEVLAWHLHMTKSTARTRTLELMEEVGLPEAAGLYDQYPHELSGGMKQRILIAMALACNPMLLIADEPTSSLDVTVQAQILDLIRQEQRRRGMAVLLITHDFGVVAQIADRVAVMYASSVVELADRAVILDRPVHPYTLGLLRSIPHAKDTTPIAPLAGRIPDWRRRPDGCAFHPRCAWAVDSCRANRPELTEVEDNHWCACTEWKQVSVRPAPPAMR